MKLIMLIFVSLFGLSTITLADNGETIRPLPRFIAFDSDYIPLTFDRGGQVWVVNGRVDHSNGTITYGYFSGNYCQVTVTPEAILNHNLRTDSEQKFEIKTCGDNDTKSGLCFQGKLGTLHLDCYSDSNREPGNSYSRKAIQAALGGWATLSKETVRIQPVQSQSK